MANVDTYVDCSHSAWRHWGCVTPKILANVKKQFSDADELDGFEELKPEDQEKLKKAFETGQVAEEDIPESARKEAADDDGEEKPKKKRAAPKKKKDADEDDDEEKPKKRVRKPAAKVRLPSWVPCQPLTPYTEGC